MMSEKKRKRGRPRTTPVISYEAEMRMRNNIPRNIIKKPKYLLDAEEEANPTTNLDDRGGSHSSSKHSRGYNPDIEDKNSEFHYGSDFETGSDNGVDSDSPCLSELPVLSEEEGVLSDNETFIGQDTAQDNAQVSAASPYRAATPEAIWLRLDRNLPLLVLPPSADDLLVPLDYFMPTLGVYEVLRHFTSLLRLSPFRFEDFCGALLSPQQNILLAEIHIALLRALIREDEAQSTHFGPMDHKDSINIMLYLVDPLTWPQVLYNYLHSDLKMYLPIVKMMEKCTYPYTSLQNRVQVLRALTDGVLSASNIREELISEGKLRYDDHCRTCHKTGDLLCCDSCTAVFHLDCLEGDAPAMPANDWTCPICTKHQVTGVYDCLSSTEESGMMCRHDPLGYDRHGRKYWFLVRRLIVESSSGEVYYYSTRQQVTSVLALLDSKVFEKDLMVAVEEQMQDFERQLSITQLITDQKRNGRQASLSNDDEEITKFLTKLNVKEEEVKHEVKEEQGNPGEEGGSKSYDTLTVKVEIKVEDSIAESKSDDSIEALHRKWDLWGFAIVGRPWMTSEEHMERKFKEKLAQLRNNGKVYRLGSECGHNYVNQYSTNAQALNKLQHNEDKDKKRHLSHKFSLSATPEFKWSGTIYGTEQDMTDCLRASLQHLEQSVSSHLYHPHWSAIRKTWLTALGGCSSPKQFSRCMVWLISAVKPVVFHAVWHDALGHVRLSRVSALEREERRRQEKKEKKDSETQHLDDYRNTLPVRFTKIPKHQLWKVRGEEYRATVGDGWRWWCRQRRERRLAAATVGLRAGPEKVMVGVNMAGGLRGLPVAPDVFNKLTAKTPGLLPGLYSPNHRRKHGLDQPVNQQEKNEIIISHSGSDGGTQKVEVMVTPLEEFFEDGLVNVSRSLVGRTRLVYPKVPVPSQLLDGLLARRLAMPSNIATKNGGEESADVDVEGDGEGGKDAVQEIPDSQRSATHRLRPAGNLLKEIRQHKLRYESLDESVFQYRCYSLSCQSGANNTCYSALCRAKTKTREKLINVVKNYTIVTSKPSPYPEVGVNDVIKLCEMDFSEKVSSNRSEENNCTSAVAKTSAGHMIGTSVEVKANKSNINSSEISVKLEQDLDESSQSSSDKFALKEENNDALPSCSGKVFLKKANAEPKTKKTVLRLPQVSACRIGRDRYSLLVLPQWELKILCRRGWRHTVSSFHHLSKSNPSVWPYQCPRPIFRHTWLYRTATIASLTAVALQLRIVWACLRWEDMQEKGPSDGKKQITTDAEIIQTEILKRKYSGRFSEKTEYLRRKVTIPFEVPKPVREFTPSQRSGLRKRRRAQSPEDKRPESIEEWIPEEQLQLWEIRLFGERLERAANQPKKSDSNVIGSTPVKITMSTSGGALDLKQRLEEQLKQQRAAFQQQQQQRDGRTLLKISSISPAGVKTSTIINPVKTIATVGTSSPPTKKFMKTKDGRIISVQTLGSIQPASSVGNTSIYPLTGSLPKVQIAPHGTSKVIRLQTVPANPRMILPRAPRPIMQNNPVATVSPNTVKLPNQNIQILRLPDGQIQVKGLLEGQQMIQRPDGKFQLLNNNTASVTNVNKSLPSISGNTVQVTQQKTHLVKPIQQQQIVKVNGQQVLVRKDHTNAQIVSVGAGEAIKSGMLTVNNNQLQTTTGTLVQSQVKTMVSSDGTMVKTIVGNVVGGGLVAQSSPVSGAATTVVNNNKTDGGSSSLTLRVQVRMTEQGPKTIIQGLQPSVGLTKDHIRAIQQQVRSMLAQYNLKVNQLSPIMTLTLHITNQSQQSSANNAPVQQQQQVIKQVSKSSIQPPTLKLPTVLAVKNNTVSSGGGNTFIRTAAGAMIPAVTTSPAPRQLGDVTPGKDSSKCNKLQQFELTDDYIQQTIQSTLSRNDLSPDVEEKLIQYKKYNTDQSQRPIPITPNNKRRREPSESSEGRGRANKSRAATADGGVVTSVSSTAEAPAKRSRRSGSSPADEAKRKQAALVRLDTQLARHKELLKKDILKKRAFLEKDLQLQIHKELGVAKQHLQTIDKKTGAGSKLDSPVSKKRKKHVLGARVAESGDGNNSNRVPTPASTVTVSTTPSNKLQPASTQINKKLSFTVKSINNKKSKSKNKKIVCICRTPFDDTKFYVGCDLCANWFHGDCVGITEASSRTMTEYVCDDCANAKLNKELYCFCKQPYDETQFYICCEQCDDWYHGRCVGIMQGEADDIDDYICPKCEPNNIWNHSCQKKLTNKDYTELKKLAKTLVSHKNAWPFLDAVDPGEVPDYYNVVSQPMDLRTVERRVRDHHYNNLAAFIGDVMLLLDNCRLYNPPNSSFVSCASTLESFFCSKVKLIKNKITSQGNH